MPVLVASPYTTVFALDYAHTRARKHAWITDFGTDLKSIAEEVGLLVLALVHGAQGTLACKRVLGNASDLFTDDPAQDRGLGIETTGREGTGMKKSGVETVGLGRTGVEGADLRGTRRDVQNTPRILCVSTTPTISLATQRQHASPWEASYSLGVHETQERSKTLQGLSEVLLKGREVPRGAGDGDRQEWTKSGDLPRVLITDSGIEEEGLFPFVEEGIQVILDYCEDEGDEGVLNSGFLVDQISRAGRHTQTLTGTPGPLLRDVAPTLKRAMDRLLDPSPTVRNLQTRTSLLVEQGEEEETIALHPAGGAAITRESYGIGTPWHIGNVMDSAIRHGLLNLIGAYARVQLNRTDPPDGIETAQRGGMLLLIDHADRAHEISEVFRTDQVSGGLRTGHVIFGRAGTVATTAL